MIVFVVLLVISTAICHYGFGIDDFGVCFFLGFYMTVFSSLVKEVIFK